jgi:hypothetical protein
MLAKSFNSSGYDNLSNGLWLSIISTFIATASLILLVTGKHLGNNTIIIAAYVSFSLLASLGMSAKINKEMIKTLVLVISLLILPLITHYFIYRDSSVTYIIHYCIAILTGFFTRNIFTRIKWDFVLYFYSIAVLFLIFLYPEGVNGYINRTYYTIPLTGLLLCNVVANQSKGSKFDVAPIFAALVIAAVSMNRATTLLVLALIFVVVVVKLFLEKKTTLTLFFRILTIFMLLVVMAIFFEFIAHLEIFKRFSNRGLDSGRFAIWAWYLSQLNLDNFFIGTNVDQTMQNIGYAYFGEAGNYSLHNVFLHTYMQGGIIAVFFLLYMFYKLFRGCSIGKDKILVMSVIGVVLVKSLVDITFFPQFTDWIYFAVLFFVSKK